MTVRIGITVAPEAIATPDSMWVNGIGQNVVYLGMLLNRMPQCAPYLVVIDDALAGAASQVLHGIPTMPLSRAVAELDIIIEIGIRFPADIMRRFRERGGRLVSYMAGNAMVMNLEAVANGANSGEQPSLVGFDAAWMTPQHWTMNHGYAALTRSSCVRVAPHIWHPCNLINSVASYGNDAFHWNGVVPEQWRIGVFDPTLNVLKTFHIPLLVCEEAYRTKTAPIGPVLLFSTARLKGNRHFENLVQALDLGRDGKVFAEDRFPFAGIMGRHIDAVVTHQWENNLNYLYWDTLYSGRPLIHNADPVAEAGYYFPAFDTKTGGRVLSEALKGHASRPLSHRAQELEVLWQFSIDNPKVQDTYGELIEEVLDLKP